MRDALKKRLLCLFFLLLAAPSFAAQDPAALRTSITYTPVYQFETDIDSGGSFRVDRHFLRLDFLKPLSRQTQIGLGVHFDFEHWDFRNLGNIQGATPWQEIHRPSLKFSVIHALNEDWRIYFAPSVGLATASLSNAGDSLVYGVAFSLLRNLGPNLNLGLGFGVFERLEETRVYPYIVVDWKITEQLRLKNPFSAGPVGPAGLELAYLHSKRWEFGVGGAYRSYRFRLASDNSVPDGVGEIDFIASFARLTRNFDQQIAVDLSFGGLFSGELGIEDDAGRSLGESGYDTAPFVALTFKGRF